MKEITSDLRTEILLSDDGTKRYSLRKVWDSSKPSLAIIMLAPSQAGEIALDTSSMLTINNCHRLGKGSVTIVNLFSKINDFALKEADTEDPENIRAIVAAAESADCVVLAAGTGKAKNKTFQQRLEQVLTALRPYEAKLHCLCDEKGGIQQLETIYQMGEDDKQASETWRKGPQEGRLGGIHRLHFLSPKVLLFEFGSPKIYAFSFL